MQLPELFKNWLAPQRGQVVGDGRLGGVEQSSDANSVLRLRYSGAVWVTVGHTWFAVAKALSTVEKSDLPVRSLMVVTMDISIHVTESELFVGVHCVISESNEFV
jgi:hypothetical protein